MDSEKSTRNLTAEYDKMMSALRPDKASVRHTSESSGKNTTSKLGSDKSNSGSDSSSDDSSSDEEDEKEKLEATKQRPSDSSDYSSDASSGSDSGMCRVHVQHTCFVSCAYESKFGINLRYVGI